MSDKMYNSGVLLLTKPLQASRTALPAVIESLSQSVKDNLYVNVQPGLKLQTVSSSTPCVCVPYTQNIRTYLADIYRHTAVLPALNTRLLISNIGSSSPTVCTFKSPVDVILLDQKVPDSCVDNIKDFVKKLLNNDSDFTKVDVIGVNSHVDVADGTLEGDAIQIFKHVCVGGTFDRLHTGHKILLTETCALARDEVTIGVTQPNMTKKKVLSELIESTEKRIKTLRQFLEEIKPGLTYNIVPISDVYGPSITVEELGCLVVSEETIKGGQMVNDKRKEKGMNEVVIHCMKLVEDQHHSQYEETKFSSSSMRKRLLGTLLKPPTYPSTNKTKPYLIGLTGGIASGKTSVAKRLQGQGAVVIDCDKLGHRAYLKGTEAFHKLVETFGQEVVGEDGEINRKVLGPKVFAAKSELEKLNNIVWPAIAELFHQQMNEYSDKDIIVLDAAVLLEAGWQSYVHEVWTTVVPRDEAIKRIMERNGLTEEAASQRIDAQMSNQEKVDRANVVICTLWEYEYTQQQVERAWKLVQDRLASIQ